MRRLLLALAAAVALLAAVGSNAATVGLPCGSNLNDAYQDAAPGDVLQLGACSYPGTTLAYDASKAGASARVVFQGQPGTVVADLNFRGAQHVEVRDVKVTNDVYAIPANNTGCGESFKDAAFVNVSAGTVFLRSAVDVTYTGGEVGHRHDGTPPTLGPFEGCELPRNVTFDGVHFTDIDSDDCAGGISACHISGFFVQGVDGLTIRNSRWDDIAVMDSFVSTIVGSATIKNVLYEGNHFGATSDGGFYALKTYDINGGGEVELRGNVFEQAVNFKDATITGCGNTAVEGMPAELTQPCEGSPPPPPPPPPPDPDPAYAPACAPTCDEQIASLNAQVAALSAERDGLASKLGQIHELSAP